MTRPLRVGFLSTYPPTICGIATFTQDLAEAVAVNLSSSPKILAVSQNEEVISYPNEVTFVIQKESKKDYLEAAEKANYSLDLVNIQHEYGIFGGKDGELLLNFLENLKKPAVTNLHTVLHQPSPNQARILKRIGQISQKIVVMNSLAIPILEEKYGISPEKVIVIPHGAPADDLSPEKTKYLLGLTGKFVVSTFGLINRGKGLEYVLWALPKVVQKFPQIVYLILGTTHPKVKQEEGESYREFLEQLVKELKLEKNVIFVNRYLSKKELVQYLVATDVYITPYLNQQQIVSGTLAYAIRFGKVIISTPYLYAQELIGKDRGILVEMANPKSIEDALFYLLENPTRFHQIREKTKKFGVKFKWSEVGKEYIRLFEKIVYSWLSPSLYPDQKSLVLTEKNSAYNAKTTPYH
ncbi:MAG: hypothetical protein PWP04_309 [Candidatus Atribacteria bacterium]|nr:hypothetical protein [Candidatus Atribacteria bacterium]